MKALSITSCQAENTFELTAAIADYLHHKLGIPFEVVANCHWQDRYRLLDEGKIDIGWICGLPYVRRADQIAPTIDLLVAPVMQGKRYQNRPIYFSDVVVKRHAPYHTFLDLRGTRWAYNEPGSQSGHNITRYHLARLGETADFFSHIINSGGHVTSLEMLLADKVEATAIDSTVLEWLLAKQASLHQQIRIIDTFAPSPIPPLVIQKSVPHAIRQQIRHALMQLHTNEYGRAILKLGQLSRFEAVTDSDYALIRYMAYQAQHIANFETVHQL